MPLCVHTPVQHDVAILPTERWGPFPHLLNLGWPCDLS